MPFSQFAAILLFVAPLAAQTPQIGGGVCSNSTLKGTFFYLIGGTLVSASQVVPYDELGKLVLDGAGSVVGQSTSNSNGSVIKATFAGTYAVQSNCTGSITFTSNSQTTPPVTFQIVNGGQEIVIALSTANGVVAGRAFSTGTEQCATASLSGTYGYLLTGVAVVSGSDLTFAETGSTTSDGNGNLMATAISNFGGTLSPVSGQGPYSVSSDCSGTAQISSSNGTANYAIAVVDGGENVLFLETDSGMTVAGTAQPQFSAPQQAAVNGASYAPNMLSPGSLFSIFGSGFAQQAASAQSVPLSRSLASTQVLVNGKPAPLLYVGPNQINLQMPIDAPVGESISLTVSNGVSSSNTASISVSTAGPGVFTYGNNQAVVQNPDGSINSAASPAHPGDILVAYLTGGGLVNATGWMTGAAAPPIAASVNSPYSVMVGGQSAAGYYLGLTPGYVGLYQANFKLPALSPGDYSMLITVAGAESNSAFVSVAN